MNCRRAAFPPAGRKDLPPTSLRPPGTSSNIHLLRWIVRGTADERRSRPREGRHEAQGRAEGVTRSRGCRSTPGGEGRYSDRAGWRGDAPRAVRRTSVRPGANAPKRSGGQVPKARRSRPQGPARCRPPRGASTVHARRMPGPPADRIELGGVSRGVAAPAARCPSAARCGRVAGGPSGDVGTVAPASGAGGSTHGSTRRRLHTASYAARGGRWEIQTKWGVSTNIPA